VGVWPYHDHSPSMEESIGGGMNGMLSILGRGQRRPDRECQVVFGLMGDFQTIDGRAFVGNTPVFTAVAGQTVQWHVMAMGSEHHTFHVHGHRWRSLFGTDVDTRTVGPAETFAIRWEEEDPGTWTKAGLRRLRRWDWARGRTRAFCVMSGNRSVGDSMSAERGWALVVTVFLRCCAR
jgi:Multicopper oxidase